jgi:hypothetical protein
MVACSTGVDAIHMVLTLLSGGLWSIVWLYCRLFAPVCACCQCGHRLSRRQLQAGVQTLAETPWPCDPTALKHTEFNSLLVARNLVYYVPTSARYRHT